MATFRRTLSMEDLVNASDDEMDNLLSLDHNDDEIVHHEHPAMSSSAAASRFDSTGAGSGPGSDLTDSAPVLELSNDVVTPAAIPRSKSVRFQEPENENGVPGTDKLSHVRVQVDQATGIMKDNLARLMERDAHLDSLSERADQLCYSSDIYQQSTEMLRRKMRWRQVRTRLFLSAVGVICIFLILVPFITKFV